MVLKFEQLDRFMAEKMMIFMRFHLPDHSLAFSVSKTLTLIVKESCHRVLKTAFSVQSQTVYFIEENILEF